MPHGTRTLTPEWKANIAAALRGNPKARAAGRLGGLANRGRKDSAEVIAKRKASRFGYRHSEETIKKIRESNRGVVRSDAWRREKSRSQKARYERNPGPFLDALAKGRLTKGPTKLEFALGRMLCGAGLEFERERRFGVYCVDAYVSELNLIFEADGSWGHNPSHDAARDQYLVRGGVEAVIRLTEPDLQPWMER